MKFHLKSINEELWNQKDFWSWKRFFLFRYEKNVKTKAKWNRKWYMLLHCSQRSNCVFDPDDSVTENEIEHISHISYFISLSFSLFSSFFCGDHSHFFFLMTCPTVEWVSNIQRVLWHCSSAKMHFRLNQEKNREKECANGGFLLLSQWKWNATIYLLFSHFLYGHLSLFYQPTHHQTNVSAQQYRRSRKTVHSILQCIYTCSCSSPFIWSFASIHL